MSFIRMGNLRQYSKGSSIYVYPTIQDDTDYIEFFGDTRVESEDFIEIMFIILSDAGIDFSKEQVNKVRESIFLEPLGD